MYLGLFDSEIEAARLCADYRSIFYSNNVNFLIRIQFFFGGE